MDDGLEPLPAECGIESRSVGQVGDGQRDAVDSLAMPEAQVVEDPDIVPGHPEGPDGMAPDIARTTDDEYAHELGLGKPEGEAGRRGFSCGALCHLAAAPTIRSR